MSGTGRPKCPTCRDADIVVFDRVSIAFNRGDEGFERVAAIVVKIDSHADSTKLFHRWCTVHDTEGEPYIRQLCELEKLP